MKKTLLIASLIIAPTTGCMSLLKSRKQLNDELIAAVRENQPPTVIKELIEQGADPDPYAEGKYYRGASCLSMGAVLGNAGTCKVLLQYGAHHSPRGENLNRLPITFAVTSAARSVCEELLRRGAYYWKYHVVLDDDSRETRDFYRTHNLVEMCLLNIFRAHTELNEPQAVQEYIEIAKLFIKNVWDSPTICSKEDYQISLAYCTTVYHALKTWSPQGEKLPAGIIEKIMILDDDTRSHLLNVLYWHVHTNNPVAHKWLTTLTNDLYNRGIGYLCDSMREDKNYPENLDRTQLIGWYKPTDMAIRNYEGEEVHRGLRELNNQEVTAFTDRALLEQTYGEEIRQNIVHRLKNPPSLGKRPEPVLTYAKAFGVYLGLFIFNLYLSTTLKHVMGKKHETARAWIEKWALSAMALLPLGIPLIKDGGISHFLQWILVLSPFDFLVRESLLQKIRQLSTDTTDAYTQKCT